MKQRISPWKRLFLSCLILLPLAAGAAVSLSPDRRRQQQQPTALSVASDSTGSARGGGATSSAWLDGLKSGLSSALAAACVKTLLQPVDAVKTLQQYRISTGGTALTVVQACREIWAVGGLSQFYAGLGVVCVVYHCCMIMRLFSTPSHASHLFNMPSS